MAEDDDDDDYDDNDDYDDDDLSDAVEEQDELTESTKFQEWSSFSENSSSMMLLSSSLDPPRSPFRNSEKYSQLSFEDAKHIWLLEQRRARRGRRSQDDTSDGEFSVSKFDDDLDQSLRQSASVAATEECITDDSEKTVTQEEEEEEQEGQEPPGKRVQFVDVTIQEYPMIPGVNPGVSFGVPVTIAWEHFDPVTLSFETYEQWREPHRRCMAQMRIPSSQRDRLLRRLGFTTSSIQASTKDANIIRNQRMKSNSIEHLDAALRKLEKTTRGIKNILTLGKIKRRERAYLLKHVPSYRNNDSRRASCPPELLLR